MRKETKAKTTSTVVTLNDFKFKKINLLPVPLQTLKKQYNQRVLLGLLVFVLTASLTSSLFYLDDYRHSKRDELNLIESRVAILEQQTLNQEVVNGIISVIDQKTKTIAALSAIYGQTSYQIKLIKSLTPHGIVFSQISKSDTNRYILSCTAEQTGLIADYIFALRTNEGIKDAFLQTVTAKNADLDVPDKNFIILLQLKEVAYEKAQ